MPQVCLCSKSDTDCDSTNGLEMTEAAKMDQIEYWEG